MGPLWEGRTYHAPTGQLKGASGLESDHAPDANGCRKSAKPRYIKRCGPCDRFRLRTPKKPQTCKDRETLTPAALRGASFLGFAGLILQADRTLPPPVGRVVVGLIPPV
jgi:hypothetical protein